MDDAGREKNWDDYNERSDLYTALHLLPVTIEDITFDGKRIKTSTRTFERTIVQIHGEGHTGLGEDTTPSIEAHERLRNERFPLAVGEHTVSTFASIQDTELHVADHTPQRGDINHLQWAIESAVLDLALKQSGKPLAGVLHQRYNPEWYDRVWYEPVRFVASPSLGDPPSLRPIHRIREAVPNLEVKIDVPEDPSETFLSELAATDAVRILDLKGQYGSDVGAPADPKLYRQLFEMLPDAIIEDPAVTDATRDILETHSDRISWDAPITDVESVRELPWEPAIINVKPCRFGRLESLCRFLDYALKHSIDLYGGGMFELDVGRAHNQALASLFYPDGPNDLAPSVYHQFESDGSLPSSPLPRPESPSGIGWDSE